MRFMKGVLESGVIRVLKVTKRLEWVRILNDSRFSCKCVETG